ncbi:hypothetical protein [Moheibacter sp.]|uniref:hypothetical protein n=1 Tax=Moheibacter sp. TaxID=1965316 RepID=UPI003C75C4C1
MKLNLICILFLSQFIFGQNHLEPAKNYFDLYDYQYEYYGKVKSLLLNGLDDRPKIRLLVFPSFSKEYIFQIENDENSTEYYNIIVKEPTEGSIWGITEGNPDFNINVTTYTSKLKKEDYTLLYQLIYPAIIKTKFRTDNSSGLDGTTYLLSIWDSGIKSSKTWSPRNPNLKELIFILETVADKARKNKEISFSKDFKQTITILTQKLNKKLTHQEIEFLLNFNKRILQIKEDYRSIIISSDLENFYEQLDRIHDEIQTLVIENGIYYSQIDDLLNLEARYLFNDLDTEEELNEVELEKYRERIKNDNPIFKLKEIYKSGL